MRKRLIKLAGGKVIPFGTDRMAKQLRDSALNEKSLVSLESKKISVLRTDQASSASYRPHPQVLDTQLLEGSEVVVIGAGAVGGYVTYFLAALASLVIHVIDFDRVDLKHTQGGRTIYEASHVRMKKVYAVKQKVERDYPLTMIIPYCYNIMDLPDIVLTRLAGKAAIVINAIDDAEGMLRVNDLLYPITEVIFAALHSGGGGQWAYYSYSSTYVCLPSLCDGNKLNQPDSHLACRARLWC